MSDKVSTIALRAIACDIEDCEQPQSWADAMRAAVSEIGKLRAEVQTARRDALGEAAQLAKQTAAVLSNPSARDALNYVAATILELGEE